MTNHLGKSRINKVNKSAVAENWQIYYYVEAGGQLEWEHCKSTEKKLYLEGESVCQCRLFTSSSVRKNDHSVMLYFAVLSYFIGSCSNLSFSPPYLFPFTYFFSIRLVWLNVSA